MNIYGKIDVLINNASMNGRRQLFVDEGDEFNQILNVNLIGTRALTKLVWPIMVGQKKGNIVNILSPSLAGELRNSAYSMTMGALLSLTRCESIEGEPLGIKVNAVCPYVYALWSENSNGISNYTGMDKLIEENISVEYISPVVAVLADENCPCTGRAFNAEGGRVSSFSLSTVLGYYNKNLTPENILDNWNTIIGKDEKMIDLFSENRNYDAKNMLKACIEKYVEE